MTTGVNDLDAAVAYERLVAAQRRLNCQRDAYADCTTLADMLALAQATGTGLDQMLETMDCVAIALN